MKKSFLHPVFLFIFYFLMIYSSPLFSNRNLVELSSQLEQREIGNFIAIVGCEIIVHCLAHTHLVLQHRCHRSHTLLILVGCYVVNILRHGIIIKLLLVVALTVVHLAHRIHIVCLQSLQGVLVTDACILLLYLRLSDFRTLFKTIEYRHSQLNAQTIGTIPVV